MLFICEEEIFPCQPLETFVFPAFAALSMTVTRKKMKKNYEAEQSFLRTELSLMNRCSFNKRMGNRALLGTVSVAFVLQVIMLQSHGCASPVSSTVWISVHLTFLIRQISQF